MNFDEARAAVLVAAEVTPQTVTLAKAFIVQNFQTDTSQLMRSFVTAMDAQRPEHVVLHQSVDPEPLIVQAGRYLAHTAAAAEAIWSLIHSDVLMPLTGSMYETQLNVGYTSVVARGGGITSGWDFPEVAASVPTRVQLVPSQRSGAQPLSDGDLYLHELNIPDLHPDVEESLHDAVRCFRRELYLPALAMLARAIEGAWIELGLALGDHPPAHAGGRAPKFDAFIRDPMVNLSQLIARVRDYYSERDLWRDVWRQSGVNEQVIRSAAIWSDAVRESRNALHYRADSALPNNYESVAVQLLAAGQHLRAIYAARQAVKAAQGE